MSRNVTALFKQHSATRQEIRYALYYSATTAAVLRTALPASNFLGYELCTSVYVAEHAKVQMF